jgi:hypothetical protein
MPHLRMIRSGERLSQISARLLRPQKWPPGLYAALAAVDICSFGGRDDHVQLHQRRVLYAQLAEVFEMTGISWTECYREDRGDGALIIVPPGVPVHHLLDPLAHHLTAALRRYNRLASTDAQLRLRVAVHAGYVYRDDHGVAGRAVVHLFRLLDSAVFKCALADSGADLGVIVSDRLYGDADGLVEDAAYRQLNVICKETSAKAWVWIPPRR